MSALRLVHTLGESVSIRHGDTELAQYVYEPDTVALESHKP